MATRLPDYAAQGGKARAAILTPEARRAAASKAARARWHPRADPAPAPSLDRHQLPDTEIDADIDPHLGAL